MPFPRFPILFVESKLLFALTSNPMGPGDRVSVIPVQAEGWLLPAYWPVVASDVRDEALRRLPIGVRLMPDGNLHIPKLPRLPRDFA